MIIDSQCYNYLHLQSDFSSKFQSPMTIFHCKNIRMQNKPNIVVNNRHLDELNISRDERTCKLVHKIPVDTEHNLDVVLKWQKHTYS